MGEIQSKYLACVVRRGVDECWGWSLRTGRLGYATIWTREGGKNVGRLAHRVSYEMHVGPIADGLEIMHTCHTPVCTNPNHLEPGTHQKNMAMSQAAGRMQRRIPLTAMPSIVNRRLDGESLQKIGNSFGCTKQAVRHMLKVYAETACHA